MSTKQKLKKFRKVLSPSIRIDDKDWDFVVPSLPSAQELDSEKLVKRVILRTDLRRQEHELSIELDPIERNRAIGGEPLSHFVLASFEGFRPLKQRATTQDGDASLQPATWAECSDYVTRLLRTGIKLQGTLYNFYGHSNSQLKSRTCFLIAVSKEEVARKINLLGDFSKMKTVGKKAKRIGLLFSDAQVVTEVPVERCEDIADIETTDYIFTDGCGLIAPILAKELARRRRVIFRDQRYTPSVFQIRYRGYKGVVTVDPRMTGGKSLLRLRKSMKKFSGGEDNSFAVVEHSKPYTYGYLNDETIVLLEALGIPRSTFLQKQEEHFQILSNAKHDYRAAFCFLSYINRADLAERVLLEGIEAVRSQIGKLVNVERSKMLNKRGEQKCRIYIPHSRLLFGVCDAWNVLNEGECAIKVTMEGNGQPRALKGSQVSVIRNPCLHPGDWQKFSVVEKPELAHLVDCIVFSTQGRRPPADMMSGGDLDGDQFFVCWDRALIPSTLSQPALYPGAREPLRFRPISDDDRLVYFAKYSNASLGRVKNLYLNWARVTGPMSSECQELNRLFSQCVDGNRIKVPERLQLSPSPNPETAAFILDDLHERAKVELEKSENVRNDWDGYELDALDVLATRDDIAIREFEAIQLALRWCRKNSVAFEQLLHLFDYNVMTDEEKTWVLEQLPASSKTPATILNALCSSNIIKESDLAYFHLNDSRVHWKCVFDSSQDRIATFLSAATRYSELFHRKLIVFRPDERLTVALFIPQKIERAKDCVVDDKVKLLAFTHSQGREQQSRLALSTKIEYRLYCDDNVFQLFEKSRGNSWIHIARPGSNDSEYRDISDVGDQRRQRQSTVDRGINFDIRTSIALQKFSKGLQQHIGSVNRAEVLAAEIYVISNRDIKSMLNLDLWLEYIETRERLPIFPKKATEYTLPTWKDLDSLSNPSYLMPIMRNQDISALADLQSIDEYSSVFDKLLEVNNKGLLIQCFDSLLAKMQFVRVDPKALFATMINFLGRASFLAISFSRVNHRELSEDLVKMLESSSPRILREFILSANEAQSLVVSPLNAMLVKLPDKSLSLRSFAQLVELTSLTVRSADVALDILLESLERESVRMLAGEPEITRYFVRHMTAIALGQVGESAEEVKEREDLLEMKFIETDDDGYSTIEIQFRIDTLGGTPATSNHVRLTAASLPTNVVSGTRYSVDALVTRSERGNSRFRCFHSLPPFFDKCSWRLEDCGSFVTTKTMFDAVLTFATQLDACCAVALPILGIPPANHDLNDDVEFNRLYNPDLNPSQNAAIDVAVRHTFTCLWGPPGTGKTVTLVQIIYALESAFPKSRILVTAPTHSAVDNAMRHYLHLRENMTFKKDLHSYVLRVSTDVRKVAEDLLAYTCDAMEGKDLYSDRRAMEQARKRIKGCRIVFTTCMGSGLGLLRSQNFEVVIVDEASQQTEPASLVPLVKGCTKAVLVGDHVQLRPTVQQLALLAEFDISLFERLYSRTDPGAENLESDGIQRLMLDSQYRMHPAICAISSNEFYFGKLHTGIAPEARPLFASKFPWPLAPIEPANSTVDSKSDYARTLFVECAAKEEPGHKSKTNEGQANLCAYICRLLQEPAEGVTGPALGRFRVPEAQSIAVITPYSRQAQRITRLLSVSSTDAEVSSIDGYQGREADIVILVTVRCNEHQDIGFLKDTRRLNVALTRARAGLIIIGHYGTLTGDASDSQSSAVWKRLLDRLTPVRVEKPLRK